MSWARCLTGTTSTPSTSAASRASGSGTNTVRQPSCRATTTMGSMAFVWRRLPSSESSPRNTEESGSSRSWPELTRTDTAIGRSYAGPAFLRSAGSQVDRDTAHRELTSRVPDGGAHTFAGLLHGGVRQPDDREGGQPGGDIYFDLDDHAVEADDRARLALGQHGQTSARVPRKPRADVDNTRPPAGCQRPPTNICAIICAWNPARHRPSELPLEPAQTSVYFRLFPVPFPYAKCPIPAQSCPPLSGQPGTERSRMEQNETDPKELT